MHVHLAFINEDIIWHFILHYVSNIISIYFSAFQDSVVLLTLDQQPGAIWMLM